MGCASASTLEMVGSSISSGRLRRTRLTRSRTSLVAVSTSMPARKRMVMRLDSARDVDSMVSMPSIPASEPSSTWVTWLSMISAEAPVYDGRHRNLRLVDIRIFADGEPAERHEADQQQDEAHYRREYGPPDAQFGKGHRDLNWSRRWRARFRLPPRSTTACYRRPPPPDRPRLRRRFPPHPRHTARCSPSLPGRYSSR